MQKDKTSFNFCAADASRELHAERMLEFDKQHQLLSTLHPAAFKTSTITKSKAFNFSNHLSENEERTRTSIELEKQQHELLTNLHIGASNPNLSSSMHMPVRISSKVSPSTAPKTSFHSISELIRKDGKIHSQSAPRPEQQHQRPPPPPQIFTNLLCSNVPSTTCNQDKCKESMTSHNIL
jgi:hypothetical protein